jgi:hypothetical protein
MMKQIADKFLEKFASRKLIAWATATCALFLSHLTSHDWVMLTMVYIGSQAAVDLVVALKQGKFVSPELREHYSPKTKKVE